MSDKKVSLLDLRSALADELTSYLSAFEEQVGGNRGARHRELHAIHIRDAREVDRRELIEPPTLDSAVASLEMALIFGEPAAGRSDWLQQFACDLAKTSRKTLASCRTLPEEVCVPVFLRMPQLEAALSPDKNDALCAVLAKMGVGSPELAVHRGEMRVAAALLFALRTSAETAFPERTARFLWSKLWPAEGDADRAYALIVIDGWDELAPDEEREHYVYEFLAQTAARMFIGSRYLPGFSSTLLRAFNDTRRQVLCLWPYELPVPTLLPSFAIWRTARDLEDLARLTSPPGSPLQPLVTVRRPRATGLVAVLAMIAIALSAYVVWPSAPPGLQITKPHERGKVCGRTPVEVTVPDASTKVWVVVHPKIGSDYFVQPESGPAYFGNPGQREVGLEFEIRAIGDPVAPLSEGQQLPFWPKARLESAIVTVARADC